MTDLKDMFKDAGDKLENAKDKAMGEIKETVGKVTDSEQLELKGKVQSAKSDFAGKVDDVKETVAGKINDAVDKNKDKTDGM